MVERRDSERPVRLSQTPQVSRGPVQQARVGQAGGAFGTHVASAPQIIRGDHAERQGSVLVQHLLKSVGGMLDAVIDDRRQQAYLDGALAVGAGIAEEDLQTNPLTRVWSLAGHRDYSGRLAALEYESSLAAELGKDREYSPEEYAKKLSERRKAIMPIIEGMSREARGRMLDQLLTLELSAQQNHLKAHKEYVAEMEMQLLTAEVNLGIDQIIAADGDPSTYQAAQAAVFTKLVRNVVDNPQFSDSEKADFITATVEYALQQGDFGLYQLVNNEAVIPMGDALVPISALLPHDQRSKLHKAYLAASKTYGRKRFADFEAKVEEFELRISLGQPIALSEFEMMDNYARSMAENGLMSRERYQRLRHKWALHMVEEQTSLQVRDAWLRGDLDAVKAGGLTDTKVADAVWRELNASPDISPVQAFVEGFQIYRNNGSPQLGKHLAESASASIRAWYLSNPDTPEGALPRDLASKVEYIVGLKASGDAGDPVASLLFYQILKDMPDETSKQFLYGVTAQTAMGTDTATAAEVVRAQMYEHSRKDEQSQRAVYETNRPRFRARLLSLKENKKWYSTGIIAGMLGDEATLTENQLKIRNFWFGGPYREAAQELIFDALEPSVQHAMEDFINYPGVIPEADIDVLITSTLQGAGSLTDTGVFVKGTGINLNQVLGIPPAYDAVEFMGAVQDTIILRDFGKEAASEVFTIGQVVRDSRGEYMLVLTPMNQSTGTTQQRVIVEQDELRRVAQNLVSSDEANKVASVTGVGIKGRDGITLKFRPANVTSDRFSQQDIARKAQMIADNEQIGLEPYKDGKKYSIGPGLNEDTPVFMAEWERITGLDKLGDYHKVPPELVRKAIEEGFEATLEAFLGLITPHYNEVVLGGKYNPRAPLSNGLTAYETISDLLLSLMWQAGEHRFRSESNSYLEVVEHLRNRDIPKARAALHRTAAYRMGGEPHKKFYDASLKALEY